MPQNRRYSPELREREFRMGKDVRCASCTFLNNRGSGAAVSAAFGVIEVSFTGCTFANNLTSYSSTSPGEGALFVGNLAEFVSGHCCVG